MERNKESEDQKIKQTSVQDLLICTIYCGTMSIWSNRDTRCGQSPFGNIRREVVR